jgi:hypothetical protein
MALKKILPSILAALVALTGTRADPLESGFRSPPHSAGIRCFWWWLNSNVTKEAITRDLEEMKAKGFNGAMIFDADGSAQQGNHRTKAGPVFGSPEWIALLLHACQEAKRLDLELSLNLQSGWNLGGPSVTAAETTQQLVWSKTDADGPARIAQSLPQPKAKQGFYRDVAVIAVPVAGTGTAPLKDLALKNATRALGMSAPDSRFLLETELVKPGETHVKSAGVIDLTPKMAADGSLTWDAPAGRWEILRIGHTATGAHVSTHSEGWGGRVIDLLSPAALDSYWNANVEPIFKALGSHAGTTLKYVHTDSWEGGGMNWTPGFDRAFKELNGYDILPWLAVLSGHIIDSREASDAFLADFRKTIGHLVAEHFTHLAKLAAKHGMVTHPECSGPHASPLDGLKNYGRSELMMSEFWSPSPHRPEPDNRFFVKQASSAAHTYGKRLVGAEGFTTIGPHWNDVPWSQMKPSFDTELCAGLNLMFVHTFTCSPAEMGMPGQEYFAGTHFNPQITWWEESTAFIDYMRRCQFLTQQGGFQADVLHYYGDHIPNIFGRKGHDPAGALPGYDYDVLSEELLLDKLTFADGKLRLPSGMSYHVLTLPDHRVLSLAALRKIDALARAGASILGPKPLRAVSLVGGEQGVAEFKQLADGLWGDDESSGNGTREVGEGRVAWGMTAAGFLANHGIAPDLAITLADGTPAPDTDWIHYRIGEADVYFLSELAGKARDIDASFRVAGRVPELWNAVDGSIREATRFTIADGRTRVPLALGAYDSHFIVFRKATREAARDTAANIPTWNKVRSVGSPWQVTFDPKLGGPAESVAFPALIDWLEHADAAIRSYSGKASYRTTLDLTEDQARAPIALELGDVRGVSIARVTLNGSDLGITWRPPYRVLLGDAATAGTNTLEVTVINSWRNRLMADEKLPEAERITRTNIRVQHSGRFQWHPESSGLLGPVRIMAPGRPQP